VENNDRLKHRILIDQLVLEFWCGKKIDPAKLEGDNGDAKDRERYLSHTFDAVDAIIVSFVADLNAQDESVRKLMYRGHFLLTLAYVAERLPLLRLEERGVYRRLRWLKMMGILSCIHKTVDGSKTLAYYKCSDLYYRIAEKRHEEAAKAAKTVKEAIAPVDHGSEKAIAPVDLSHSPVGLSSLSNIGNITLPPPADGLKPSPAEAVKQYPELPGMMQELAKKLRTKAEKA